MSDISETVGYQVDNKKWNGEVVGEKVKPGVRTYE